MDADDIRAQAELLRLIAKAMRLNDPGRLEWAADELERQLADAIEYRISPRLQAENARRHLANLVRPWR